MIPPEGTRDIPQPHARRHARVASTGPVEVASPSASASFSVRSAWFSTRLSGWPVPDPRRDGAPSVSQ